MSASEAQVPQAPLSNIELSLDQNLYQTNTPALELRPVWLEILFNIGTIGLYTCIWFYKRTKEFNQSERAQFKPILWFFVPFIVLAELFALPKFVAQLNKIEARAGLSPWRGGSKFWIFGVVVLTLFGNLANKYEFPSGLLTLFILLWAVLMSLPAERLYRARIALAPAGSKFFYKVKWHDWLTLVLGSLIFLAAAAMDLQNLFTNHIQQLANNSRYSNSEHKFSLPILGDGWHQVEVGSNSDGSALIEFQGPLSDMYYLVFENDTSETVASVSEARLELILNADKDAQCDLSHHLDWTGTKVVARIHCSSSYFGDPAIFESTSIRTEKGVYELYGFFSSSKLSFRQASNNFINMAREFRAE